MNFENQEKINTALKHLKNAYEEISAGVLILNELIGIYDSIKDFNTYISNVAKGVESEEKEFEKISETKGVVIFSEKEILQMPKNKRNYFRIAGRKVSYRKTIHGVFELRKQIDGIQYYGASRNLKEAKERFIEDLKLRSDIEERLQESLKRAKGTVAENIASAPSAIPDVESYAYEYLFNFKKPNICARAYRGYENVVKNHIATAFGDSGLDEITATDCQRLLNKLREEGKKRTAESVHSLLNWIFAAAVADKYITHNPMLSVKIPKHRRTSGNQIPREIVAEFLRNPPKRKYDALLRFMLFTGIRPCEIESAVFEGDFVTIKNAKQRAGEDATFRRIPLHSKILGEVDEIKRLIHGHLDKVRLAFRNSFPDGYRLYDLRHTFTSRMQECHASKEYVDYVTNHVGVQNVTARVYTHWSDEFQREQIELLYF